MLTASRTACLQHHVLIAAAEQVVLLPCRTADARLSKTEHSGPWLASVPLEHKHIDVGDLQNMT
jgi:hypothetical protein